MRYLLLIPASIVLVMASGICACAATGRSWHPREMSLAAGAILLASVAGVTPSLLVRKTTQLVVSQTALAGSMIHLFVAMALAAAAVLGGVGLQHAFMYWLLSFYWTTLIALVIVFAKAIRSAPTIVATPGPSTP